MAEHRVIEQVLDCLEKMARAELHRTAPRTYGQGKSLSVYDRRSLIDR